MHFAQTVLTFLCLFPPAYINLFWVGLRLNFTKTSTANDKLCKIYQNTQ